MTLIRLRWQWTGLMLVVCACTGVSNQVAEVSTEPDPEYYTEQHRPQFHFSPEANWMNDPNGMFYFQGEYHLFYQYYPDSTVWGPMHWGHAVSKDLVLWEHLPIALYPDEHGYIFSGSAVVDRENTSGLGTADKPPIVAIFTYHDPDGAQAGVDTFETQGVAFSVDKGRTWTTYDENPVLKNGGKRDFRDPKVFWFEPTQRWIMILAVGDHVEFYQSVNLLDWQYLSEFGSNDGSHIGVWECPDLIPLSVENRNEEQWVLIVSVGTGAERGSATQYFVGDFNGTHFTNAHYPERVLWVDQGRDNYAGVTWSGIPPADGRTIFLAWMSNWDYAQVVPTERWRSSMTLPRRLSLFETVNGPRVRSYPVIEVETFRTRSMGLNRLLVNGKTNWSRFLDSANHRIDMELVMTRVLAELSWEILLNNDAGDTLRFGFDDKRDLVYVDRRAAGDERFSEKFARKHEAMRLSSGDQMPVRVLIDESSIEFFADLGEVVFTDLIFPSVPYSRMEFRSVHDQVLVEGAFYHLKSVWR